MFACIHAPFLVSGGFHLRILSPSCKLRSNKSGQNMKGNNSAMYETNTEQFAQPSRKAVKKELRSTGWPVYEHYEIAEEDGEVFVVASVSPASFVEPEPMEEGVVQEGEMKGRR